MHQNCTRDCATIASFINRGSRWRAQVRKFGQPALSKAFATKREAEIWARHIELQIDRGLDNQRVPLLRGPCEVGCRLIDPLEIIERQPSAWTRQGRIFPHAAQSISKAFQRATSSVGIEDLHFHDLRHDGASRLFEVGDTIEQVALVTGHRDWNMLRRRPN